MVEWRDKTRNEIKYIKRNIWSLEQREAMENTKNKILMLRKWQRMQKKYLKFGEKMEANSKIW